jgi:hypothetical protein
MADVRIPLSTDACCAVALTLELFVAIVTFFVMTACDGAVMILLFLDSTVIGKDFVTDQSERMRYETHLYWRPSGCRSP